MPSLAGMRVPVLSIVAVCLLTAVGASQTLDQKLMAINLLRNGPDTPFAEVEQRCGQLLQEYPAPEDQGKINYTLALVYAQTGQMFPDTTIVCCRKALGLPLSLDRRLKLYTWWGDAIQVANRGKRGADFASARRQAAVPYLEGIKAAIDAGLRAGTTAVPTVPIDSVRILGSGIDNEKRKADYERAVAATWEARRQSDQAQLRDVLAR
jgi:hypothetical protein